ncbi:MAG: GAF domain-containing protein, partial [candidate division Zixibacteria bacterium]
MVETKSRKPDQLTTDNTDQKPADLFADLEATLEEVAESNPRIAAEGSQSAVLVSDLQALLEASLAINSTLVLDDVLQVVMHKAIDLMQAERGFIMVLDDDGELQTRAAYNISREGTPEDEYRISMSIASEVAQSGKSIYASDAMTDERFASQQSILELHLRSIMCVPVKLKSKVVGVMYVDNSRQAKMFLKADLYLFELYAQLATNALHNAGIYDSLLHLKEFSDSIINSSPVGIIVIDDVARLAAINPTALQIFETNIEDIKLISSGKIPTTFSDLLPDNQIPRWQKMINAALATNQELSDPRFFHNTGYLEKILSVKMLPLDRVNGGGSGLTMTVEDVTEKALMEKYVILSEKLVARGEMAASIAHELNNYLSIISNNAELLGINIDRELFDKARFNSKSIIENVFKIKRF